jgi:hypothetical protein
VIFFQKERRELNIYEKPKNMHACPFFLLRNRTYISEINSWHMQLEGKEHNKKGA